MPVDYSRYSADWHELSKYIRFERAGNRCEWCGAENYKPHPVTGGRVVLTVAHWPDSDTQNNDPANLHALCQKCHNTADAPMRAKHAKATRADKKAQAREDAGQRKLL